MSALVLIPQSLFVQAKTHKSNINMCDNIQARSCMFDAWITYFLLSCTVHVCQSLKYMTSETPLVRETPNHEYMVNDV